MANLLDTLPSPTKENSYISILLFLNTNQKLQTEDSSYPRIRGRQGTDNMDVVAPASIHGGIGDGVPD